MLRGEQRTLGIQHFDIAHRAVLIERSGTLLGRLQRSEVALLSADLVSQALAQGQRIGDLFEGGLNFLLIIHHRLLLADFC